MPKGIPKNGINNGWFKKGVKSHKWTKKQKEKVSIKNKGNKHGMWKGDNAKYCAIHEFISKWKGKPKKCEMCGTTKAKKYEWANIDHKYSRVLEDYIRMCTKCHLNFDREKNRGRWGNK